ncbi:MAG: aminoglycoside 6-adenylyltransferase [Candidatus Heimdallarchaeota archaeon]
MSDSKPSYEQLVERFVKWAETCSDIRGTIIVGSRAQIDNPTDEWADLDIMVITTDPKHYLATADWVANIGKPLLTFVEPTPGDDMERRVLFKGMLDVDFAIIPERKIQL